MTEEEESLFKNALKHTLAEFPGGDDKLTAFLANAVQNSTLAKVLDFKATVTVAFIINEKGELSDFKIEDAANNKEIINDEAIRIAQTMPRWIPAKYENKPVWTECWINITFE